LDRPVNSNESILIIISGDSNMVESGGKETREGNSGGENLNIENKGEYFEWICSKCRWGARGYDKSAIVDIRRRHNELGCRQFASEVKSKGLRIDN
jgi:hypothetical protein